MTQKRISLTHITFMSIGIIGLAYSCGAEAAHLHCLIPKWSLTSSATQPRVPANVGTLTSFSFKPILNEPPPPGTKDCAYEISDITQIDVNLTYTGTIDWSYLVVGNANVSSIAYPAVNASGDITSYQFKSHLGEGSEITPGPIEVAMPSGAFTIRFESLDSSATITSASVTLSGHHYYLPVPEPTSITLILTGLFILYFSSRTQGQRIFRPAH